MFTEQMLPGLIRSAVVLIVGWLAGLFLTAGVELDQDSQLWLTNFLAFALALAYYLLVRYIETKFPGNRWISLLLGTPKRPDFNPAAQVIQGEIVAGPAVDVPDGLPLEVTTGSGEPVAPVGAQDDTA